MRRVALGVFTYMEFVLLGLLFLVPMGLSTLLSRGDPGQRLRGRWMRRFGRLTATLSPLWRFSVEGPTPPGIDREAYVVVANHQSTADPFLLSSLPWDMRWVAKEELFRQPLVGWLMHLSGDIALRRGEKASVLAMLEECRRTLAAGVSVMLFPEGTRSADGSLQPFKDGAFQLAIEAGVPMLPVVVHGTRSCRPKGSRWFGDASAVALVLDPVPTRGLTLADLPALKATVHERIAAGLQSLQLRDPALAATSPMALARS